MICWSCQKEAGAGVLCAACAALQPPDDNADLFAVLGQPARYAVDLAATEAAYKDRSRQVHPDRYATADPRARRASLARTVQLNLAWRTLKDPVRRAEYMLTRAGIDIGGKQPTPGGEEKRTVEVAAPPAFLLEILELNDDLAAAKRAGDSVKVAFMAEEMRGRARESRKGPQEEAEAADGPGANHGRSAVPDLRAGRVADQARVSYAGGRDRSRHDELAHRDRRRWQADGAHRRAR
jgi:molecular chaperone HscB